LIETVSFINCKLWIIGICWARSHGVKLCASSQVVDIVLKFVTVDPNCKIFKRDIWKKILRKKKIKASYWKKIEKENFGKIIEVIKQEISYTRIVMRYIFMCLFIFVKIWVEDMFENSMYPADDNYLGLFAFNRRAYRGKKKKSDRFVQLFPSS